MDPVETNQLTIDDALVVFEVATRVAARIGRAYLRGLGALEGALARPLYNAVYADADLATQAAVLAHAIAEAQSFLDGNKRTAFLAVHVFLDKNGLTLHDPEDELAGWILAFSECSSIHELADWIRARLG